jgi:lysophospholipase L1-like esterase
MTIIEKDSVVLFQGDSVTDTGRSRQDDNDLGKGYAAMTAAWFNALYPEKNVRFINRGISGNRVKDLKERWVKDCIDLKPTWVSILIGINDCWRKYDRNDATTAEKYEEDYRNLLDDIKHNIDGAKIILLEPFVLPVPEDRKQWREDLDPKIHVVRTLSREYNTLYVALDGIFAQALASVKPDFWAKDGVHPTPAGHALIANNWLKAVKAI